MRLNALVEGAMDEAAAYRLILETGHNFGLCYGKRGLPYIRKKIGGFNQAARDMHILCLVDFMDTGFLCPPEVIAAWLPHRHPNMVFRIVVRELEGWLLADRSNIANFLGVNTRLIPTDPELEHDPKRTLVNLARHSRYRIVRDALVPGPGSGAVVGKLYTSEMTRFIRENWDIQAARANSQSLDTCLARLEELF